MQKTTRLAELVFFLEKVFNQTFDQVRYTALFSYWLGVPIVNDVNRITELQEV